jgi:hypothetical protein
LNRRLCLMKSSFIYNDSLSHLNGHTPDRWPSLNLLYLLSRFALYNIFMILNNFGLLHA